MQLIQGGACLCIFVNPVCRFAIILLFIDYNPMILMFIHCAISKWHPIGSLSFPLRVPRTTEKLMPFCYIQNCWCRNQKEFLHFNLVHDPL